MILDDIRENSTEGRRKFAYTIFSFLCVIMSFAMLFISFCKYPVYSNTYNSKPTTQKVAPYIVLSLLKDSSSLDQGLLLLGLILFIAWLGFFVGICVSFAKIPLRFGRDEIKIKKNAIRILTATTIFAGAYFIFSFLYVLICRANGSAMETANNVYPLIIMLVIDAVFALYIGIFQQEEYEEEQDDEEEVPKVKQLKRAKIELFLYLSLIFVCAIVAFLSNVIKVTFIGSLSKYDFQMNGLDLLKDYPTEKAGAQILAFVLFLSITLVSSFFAIALIALLGKSKTYFRFAIISTVVSVVCTFLIGMYGKYYQMIQSINAETIASWLSGQFSHVNADSLLSSITGNFEVHSNSFYFFILALVLSGVILIRKPYSRGVALEAELGINPNELNAEIENSNIKLDNIKDALPPAATAAAKDAPKALEEQNLTSLDPCPAFTELDDTSGEFFAELENKRNNSPFIEPTLPKLVQYIVQYARDSRLHLFYTAEDIATFIAGLGTTKLTILQGMSGTGKTSLPKIFSEALMSNCEIIEVESSWRDKNELLGYYNEFSKTYTPKKFTQALYKACLNPETLTFIVLDEMNLSRIEYYFSDFLSLMENEPDKRAIKLLNVGLFRTDKGKKIAYKRLEHGHTVKILPNVWFIGTANRDESTFEISDKVYDRAHTMNFNKRAQKVRAYNEPLSPKFLSVKEFNRLLEEAKSALDFTIENYPLIAEVEKLLAPYNISFGNRIAMQIESFVSIYCACFTTTEEVIFDAVERILLSKVVSKLELKSVENKEELAAAFMDLGLTRCGEFISKLNED